MKHVLILIIFLLLAPFVSVADEGSGLDKIVDSLKGSFEEIKEEGEVLQHLKDAYQKQSQASATQRAAFYYENQVNTKPQGCNDCPEYLKLIGEVNSIIEKLPPPTDIARANEQTIQLDRLKFMYIESVSASMGNEVCSILNNSDPLQPKGLEKNKLKLIFEEMTHLPNVTSMQFYPMPPEKERRYFYRGEGLQSHIIVEVIVKADETALIRYHHYDQYNLPNFTTTKSNLWDVFDKEGTLGDNLSFKTETDIGLQNQNVKVGLKGSSGKNWLQIEGNHTIQSEAKFKAIIPMEIDLSDNKNIKLTGQISHEQKQDLTTDVHDQINKVEVNLTNSDKGFVSGKIEKNDNVEEVKFGSGYQMKLGDKVSINAKVEHRDFEDDNNLITNQNLSFSLKDTKGNHEFISAQVTRDSVDEQTQEKIAFSTKHQWELDKQRGLKIRGEAMGSTLIVDDNENSIRTNEMLLSLTDHNHEYVTARVVQGNTFNDLFSVSSGYKVGDYGRVKGTFEHYESGKEAYSVGHVMERGKNSFETSVGVDTEAGNYFSFKAQRKISSTASMVLTVKTDTNDDKSIMYQYQSKF